MASFKKILWLAFLLLFNLNLYGQTILSGTVKDASTGRTIPGVNVYLSGTSIGDATNAKGKYYFEAPGKGSFELVYSFVGYHKKVMHLDMGARSAIQQNVSLKIETHELIKTKVTGSNKIWQKRYERFKKTFIGQSPFAKRTHIENPYIINFNDSDDEDYFVASAKEPLIIVNHALGYKIRVELAEFKWAKYQDIGQYKIYPRYIPLTPRNRKQEREWQKNRIKAFSGSLGPFLKALYDGKLKRSDFSVKRSHRLSTLTSGETDYELFQRGISASRIEQYKGFKLNYKISVNYHKIVHYKLHGDLESIVVNKKSAISPNTTSKNFFVYKNGDLLNPLSLITYGDWSKSRLGDSLPLNYKIGN